MKQTKKALEIYTKGEVSTPSPLAEHRERYLQAYEQTEQEIIAKQNADNVQLPFLESLRRKVAKMVNSPDQNLPVVTRFDLYTGIRKLAERSTKDNGLKKLSQQLERGWHNEPLGTLTYGQVQALVKQFKDQYPRSKAADAIEAECTRVGLHKLPVARLARIAGKIESQADYDAAMEANGFAGDRPEQIRARALVRGLVELRGLQADAHLPSQKDDRSAVERVSDRIASLHKNADYNMAMSLMQKATALSKQLQQMLDKASMELHGDGLEADGQKLNNLASQLDGWVASLEAAATAAAPAPEVSAPAPSSPQAPKQPADPQPAGPVAPTKEESPWPGFPGLQPEFKPVEEQDMENAGLGRKWYDPRTWFQRTTPATASLMKSVTAALDTLDDCQFKDELSKFASDLQAQMAPPMEDPEDELLMEEPGLDMPKMDPMGPDELGGDMMDGEVQMPELDEGAQLIQEIEQAADEIILDAPPEAADYIDHEMAEDHMAPPGTAQWGAEEILNEGHTAPPPTDEWLQEEMDEMAGGGPAGGPGMDLGGPMAPPSGPPMGAGPMGAPPKPPMKMPMGASMKTAGEKNKGKGIPLPGKIQTHPKVTTYAKDVGKDGGKVLKAADIENLLLRGETVKVGHVAILINDANEVEVWNKDAGRACDLLHLDGAIADFIGMVRDAQKAKQAEKLNCTFRIAEMVHVPCEACGDMTLFTKAANISEDEYNCPCGHLISARSVDELMALTKWGKAFQMNVQYPLTQDPNQNKLVRERILRALHMLSAGNVKIDDEGRGYIVSTLWNVEDGDVAKLQKQMQAMGAQPQSQRVGQEMGGGGGGGGMGMGGPKTTPQAPAAPAVPTNADMPGMTLADVANAAFLNYRAQGLPLMDAMKTFVKEHGERWGGNAAEDPNVMAAMMTNYSGGGGAPAGGAPGMGGGATPPPSPATNVMAAVAKDAQEKANFEPKVRKPKDHVSVPKDLGPDSETKGGIPSPGSIKSQPNKQQHQKLSPKDLGKDSEGKDLLPDPGKPKMNHLPTDQKGISLPEKGLDGDHEGDDPFKTPSLGKKPSVKNKQKI